MEIDLIIQRKLKKHLSEIFKGENNPFYGKKHSKETLIKISGQNNNNWKGGVTKLYKKIYDSYLNKKWRSKIFERDNWTCQTCGKRGGYLEVHHIKAKSKIIKENDIKTIEDALKCEELWDVNNGVTLCKDCHKLTKNYGNKK